MPDGELASQLDALGKRVVAMEALDVSRHVRTELEAQVNFAEFRSDFETLKEIGRRIRALDLSSLPTSVVADGVTAFERVQQQLSQIEKFSVLETAQSGRNVPDARNTIATNFRASCLQFVRDISPLLAFAAAMPSEEWQARAGGEMLALSGELHSMAQESRASLENLKRLELLAKESVQKVGIASHAKHFESEATGHETAASRWLVWLIVFATAVRK